MDNLEILPMKTTTSLIDEVYINIIYNIYREIYLLKN